MPACNQVFGHGIFNCWFDHFTIMCWCRSRHRPRVQWPKLTNWCLWSRSQGTCMYLVGSHYTWGFHVNLSKFYCTSTGQVKPHNWPLPALYRTGETSQLTSTSTVQDRWNLTIDLYWHPYRTGELSQLTSTGTRTGQVNSHNWPSINWPPLAPVQDRWNLTIDQVSIDLHWHRTGQVKPHNWPLLAPYRTGELSQLTSTGTRTGQVNSLLVQLVALIKYHEGYCGCHNLIVPVQNRSALTVQLVAPIKYNGGFKESITIACTQGMTVVLAATLE